MSTRKSQRDPARLCIEVLDTGLRCGAYKLSDSEYCYNHDPRHREEVKEHLDQVRAKSHQRRRENAHSRQLVKNMARANYQYVGAVPDVSSPEALLAYGAEIAPMILDGTISPDQARVWASLYLAMVQLHRNQNKGMPAIPALPPPLDGEEPMELPSHMRQPGPATGEVERSVIEVPDFLPPNIDEIVREDPDERPDADSLPQH